MKPLLTILFCFLSITFISAQTQKDTIYTLYTANPVIVDGSDSDPIWAKSTWHPMKQVWIPYNEVMKEGDFEGQFKVAWDKNYLYVLVQVVDDSLSDDHVDPLDNYWNDDCVELFIDEDRSGGNHQNNNNAFAYHCSTFYDVIDGAGPNGTTINCKKNITMKMDTIGPHTYLWEFAVKMYNKNFVYTNPDPYRVYLSPNKLMGFSVAYCDNDQTTERENFIGSVTISQAHANDSYINCDYFGTMLLVDPDKQYVSSPKISDSEKRFTLFPNPVNDKLQIISNKKSDQNTSVKILSIDGRLVGDYSLSKQKEAIMLNNLAKGLYMVKITQGNYTQSEVISVK